MLVEAVTLAMGLLTVSGPLNTFMVSAVFQGPRLKLREEALSPSRAHVTGWWASLTGRAASAD